MSVRFVLKDDDGVCCAPFYVWDCEDCMVVCYVDECEVDVALEFVEYLNRLDDDLVGCCDELSVVKYYLGLGLEGVVSENKSLRRELNYSKFIRNAEVSYARDVLNSLIAAYPNSSGLLEFKSMMDW